MDSHVILGPNFDSYYSNDGMIHDTRGNTSYFYGSDGSRTMSGSRGGTSYQYGNVFSIHGNTFYDHGNTISGNGKIYYLNGTMLTCGSKVWYNVHNRQDIMYILEKDNS